MDGIIFCYTETGEKIDNGYRMQGKEA